MAKYIPRFIWILMGAVPFQLFALLMWTASTRVPNWVGFLAGLLLAFSISMIYTEVMHAARRVDLDRRRAASRRS